MKIAIIGGGASGLITGYLLHKNHQVHIFERDEMLGGNIRTLNANVPGTALPPGICIENGVLGFHVEMYPNFHRLMKHLDVPLHQKYCAAGLFEEGFFTSTDTRYMRKRITPLRRPRASMRVLRYFLAAQRYWKWVATHLHDEEMESRTFADCHPFNAHLGRMLKGVLMISFSTPYADVDALPASLSLPFIEGLRSTRWSFVTGGVYRYIERLLALFDGRVNTGAGIKRVARTSTGVVLEMAGTGERLDFDAVVFATTPGQVLQLLADADDTEKYRFAPWTDRNFETIAHAGDGFYRPFPTHKRTPMDIFRGATFSPSGYNTYMNHVYDLSPDVPYSFAYAMDDHIATDSVLHRHIHTVPVYTPAAYATRHAIVATNGHRNTYFAGAYLGNGLHEGAVWSAMQVAGRLGGIQF